MEIAAGNLVSGSGMKSRTNVSKALVSALTSESDFFAFSRKGSDKFDFKLDPRRINRNMGKVL